MTVAPIGLLGGACFAWAAVPSAWTTVRLGRNPGVPVLMAWLIFAGTVLLYSYLALNYMHWSWRGIDWILTTNYTVEALSWGTILKYTYWPRKQCVSL